MDGKAVLHRVQRKYPWQVEPFDGRSNRTGACPNQQLIVGKLDLIAVLVPHLNGFYLWVDTFRGVTGQQRDAWELRSVGQRMPVGGLAAQIKGQTADAVVGKLVGKHEGDIATRIEFVCAEPSGNAGIAATNDQKPHLASPFSGCLWRGLNGMDLEPWLRRFEVSLTHPERHVNKADQGGDFDQRSNHPDKGFARVEPEDRDSHSDRQLKIVPGCCEGESCCLCIVRAELLAHPEADKEHDDEIDHQRNCNLQDIERKADDQIPLEAKHDQNREQERDQGKGTYLRNELRSVPLLAFRAYKYKSSQRTREKWNSQIDKDAVGDLADADVHHRSLIAEPSRQDCDEYPRIKAVENNLEDTVERNESGNVVCVSASQLIPDQHHRDATGNPDQDQAAHVCRLTVQERQRQAKHEQRTNDPVLNQGKAEDAAVAKDLAKLLVPNLS